MQSQQHVLLLPIANSSAIREEFIAPTKASAATYVFMSSAWAVSYEVEAQQQVVESQRWPSI